MMNAVNTNFSLDPRLENESIHLGTLGLCQALFKNDSQFPWLILVPQRDTIQEITDLSPNDRILLIEEIALASEAMQTIFKPNKLNIAALGNVVPQLHIHIIARYHTDIAWPTPVWGKWPAQPYTAAKLTLLTKQLQTYLKINS